MQHLLDEVLDAHGGLDEWRKRQVVVATITSGGALLKFKGMPQDDQPWEMSVATHRQWVSCWPFGGDDQRTRFTPDRVAIEKLTGEVVAESWHPRETFERHTLTTAWNPLQRAYFNGYAFWTYLTTPFAFTLPGVEVSEVGELEVGGERWPRLHVSFPGNIATHNQEQDFYYGDDGLLRRHDYNVEIVGGLLGMHYVYEYAEFDGFLFPTKRRAYRLDERTGERGSELMIWIDLSNIRVESAE